jgi:hypothetical protein
MPDIRRIGLPAKQRAETQMIIAGTSAGIEPHAAARCVGRPMQKEK